MPGSPADLKFLSTSGKEKMTEDIIKEIRKVADEQIERINDVKKIRKAGDEAIKEIEKAGGGKRGKRWVHTDIYTFWTVLTWTILSAAGLMAIAIVIRIANPSIDTTKDVLPLATALVGFAGGVVTAIYGKETAANGKKIPESDKE